MEFRKYKSEEKLKNAGLQIVKAYCEPVQVI